MGNTFSASTKTGDASIKAGDSVVKAGHGAGFAADALPGDVGEKARVAGGVAVIGGYAVKGAGAAVKAVGQIGNAVVNDKPK